MALTGEDKKKYNKEYYMKNFKKLREYNKAYREKNRDKQKEYREWRKIFKILPVNCAPNQKL